MPYLILALGIIASLYALYRFFIKASPEQIKNLLLCTISAIFCLILIFFALTGRIIISLALLLISIPFIISHFKSKSAKKDNKKKQDDE